MQGAGTLTVHLSRASGLRAADSNGKSDPYVKIKIGGQVERSAVVQKTLEPTFDWDFNFAFSRAPLEEQIVLEVFDHDNASLNDSLGNGTVSLAEHAGGLAAGNKLDLRVPLEYRAGPLSKAVPAGAVFVTLSWREARASLPDAPALPPPPPKGKPPSFGGAAGMVQLHVVRATNLRAADRDGLSDPYIKVRLGGMVERSEVFPKTLKCAELAASGSQPRAAREHAPWTRPCHARCAEPCADTLAARRLDSPVSDTARSSTGGSPSALTTSTRRRGRRSRFSPSTTTAARSTTISAAPRSHSRSTRRPSSPARRSRSSCRCTIPSPRPRRRRSARGLG